MKQEKRSHNIINIENGAGGMQITNMNLLSETNVIFDNTGSKQVK